MVTGTGSEPMALSGILDPVLRDRVETLYADYGHCIDDGEIERWPEHFTEGGFYQVITRESYQEDRPIGIMHCEGQGMMRDRVRAMREANIFEPHRYTHVTERPRFAGREGARVEGRANFFVTRTMQSGEMTLFACGKYLDVIEIGVATPRFVSRRVVLESRRVDVLLVYPL